MSCSATKAVASEAGWSITAQAYGGMKQYVVWSCQRRGLPVDDKLKTEQFYTDPACQDIYSNMLATVTSRVNTVTGTAYRCVLCSCCLPT